MKMIFLSLCSIVLLERQRREGEGGEGGREGGRGGRGGRQDERELYINLISDSSYIQCGVLTLIALLSSLAKRLSIFRSPSVAASVRPYRDLRGDTMPSVIYAAGAAYELLDPLNTLYAPRGDTIRTQPAQRHTLVHVYIQTVLTSCDHLYRASRTITT